MKDLEKLKLEQKELKEKLLKLIDFINSEEYFTLNETEKSLLMSQRTGMEIYLNSLTQRIYGERRLDAASGMLPLMLMSMFNPFHPSPQASECLKEQPEKKEDKEK